MENVFGAEYLERVEAPAFGAKAALQQCHMDDYGTVWCSWTMVGSYEIA